MVWLLCLKSVHGKVCQASQNLLLCFCFCFFGSSLSHILVKSISYGSVFFVYPIAFYNAAEFLFLNG